MKDALLIAGDKLPSYLAGTYTLSSALADLCAVPVMRQQLLRASSGVPHQGPGQAAPGGTAAAGQLAAAGSSSNNDAGGASWLHDVPITRNATEAAAAAAAIAEVDASAEAATEEHLAASLRLPSGLAIGSSTGSRSLGRPSSSSGGGGAGVASEGSHPSLLQLLQRERQQQQVQPAAQQASPRGPHAQEAEEAEDGFADAYLDPPMPSADQLSLFTEVQQLVGRRQLQPVLHCVLHRMLFALPFDDRLHVTLDTSVKMAALVSQKATYF